MDLASWLGLPPGVFWKSCLEFWFAALVLLVSSAVATREARERKKERKRDRGGERERERESTHT